MAPQRALAAALAFILLASAPAAGITYQNNSHHFEFTLPGGWITWPKETLAAANQFARDRARAVKIEYAAGFQPQGQLFGAYPYMLVQVQAQNNANSSYEDIERGLSKGMNSAVRDAKKAIADLARELTVGSAVLDRANNRVVIRYELDMPNFGKIQAISLAMIGKESIVTLHYYDKSGCFDESVKMFLLIGNSFEFEKDYRFTAPKPSALLCGLDPSTFIVGLLAALGAVVAGILWYASNKKSNEAYWSSSLEPRPQV